MNRSLSATLAAFRRAANQVPAYQQLLKEAGVNASSIRSLEDFRRLPVLEKRNTFQRFEVAQLCVGGELGHLGTVLTSSGHSGIFAFGLSDSSALPEITEWIDNLLDTLFQVRSKPSLLINCLPMGVKIPTQACTLAETSVRADMVVGLVGAFAQSFRQIILVGETAFIKHLLELGRERGMCWRDHLVHVIVGEEPLAENGRIYIEGLLGHDSQRDPPGRVISSMGVAELGLNLFFEAPPHDLLVRLRRTFHQSSSLRCAVFGDVTWVPSLFAYDPDRIFVEFDENGSLLVTTLQPNIRLPLVRYRTGDMGRVLQLPAQLRPELESAGLSWAALQAIEMIEVRGRGECVLSGNQSVYPEAVKEGIYADAALVGLTTANFRLETGAEHARIRLQLTPGQIPDPEVAESFRIAIGRYIDAPFELVCEPYHSFQSGMALDYERKFKYIE